MEGCARMARDSREMTMLRILNKTPRGEFPDLAGIFYRRGNLPNRVVSSCEFLTKKNKINKKRKDELFDVHALNSRNAIAGLSN